MPPLHNRNDLKVIRRQPGSRYVLTHTLLTKDNLQRSENNTSISCMHQIWRCKAPKHLIRKNRDHVSLTQCSGAMITDNRLKKNKLNNTTFCINSLHNTIESCKWQGCQWCHNFFQASLFTNILIIHLCLLPVYSSPFHGGKIFVYANIDYHKISLKPNTISFQSTKIFS